MSPACTSQSKVIALCERLASSTKPSLRGRTLCNSKKTASLHDEIKVASQWLIANFNKVWSRQHSQASSSPIDVIDMFCGCGGMSAGFAALNRVANTFRIAGAVDIDHDSIESYARNFGTRPINLSVSELAEKPKLLRTLLNKFDVRPQCQRKKPLILIGCSPCQGFSSHRRSTAPADVRNNLFLDFIQVAITASPDVVVMENVPEILSDDRWPYIERARTRLEDAGYFVHISYHNTAAFGVPQNRFRALLLAMKKPFLPLGPILSPEEYFSVRDAIGALPPLLAGEKCKIDEMHYTVRHKASTIETIRKVTVDGGNLPLDAGPPCLQRAFARRGKRVYEDVYGRLRWDAPAVTITAHARNPASGRFVHPASHRGLSVREAALLQGFPKDYWFAGSLDNRFRQIGNAVPPLFATCLAIHLLGQLSEPSSKEFLPGVTAPIGASFSRAIPGMKKR